MGFRANDVDEDDAGVSDEEIVKLVDALAAIVIVVFIVPASGLFYKLETNND